MPTKQECHRNRERRNQTPTDRGWHRNRERRVPSQMGEPEIDTGGWGVASQLEAPKSDADHAEVVSPLGAPESASDRVKWHRNWERWSQTAIVQGRHRNWECRSQTQLLVTNGSSFCLSPNLLMIDYFVNCIKIQYPAKIIPERLHFWGAWVVRRFALAHISFNNRISAYTPKSLTLSWTLLLFPHT
jgi:hypothetical protein